MDCLPKAHPGRQPCRKCVWMTPLPTNTADCTRACSWRGLSGHWWRCRGSTRRGRRRWLWRHSSRPSRSRGTPTASLWRQGERQRRRRRVGEARTTWTVAAHASQPPFMICAASGCDAGKIPASSFREKSNAWTPNVWLFQTQTRGWSGWA